MFRNSIYRNTLSHKHLIRTIVLREEHKRTPVGECMSSACHRRLRCVIAAAANCCCVLCCVLFWSPSRPSQCVVQHACTPVSHWQRQRDGAACAACVCGVGWFVSSSSLGFGRHDNWTRAHLQLCKLYASACAVCILCVSFVCICVYVDVARAVDGDDNDDGNNSTTTCRRNKLKIIAWSRN